MKIKMSVTERAMPVGGGGFGMKNPDQYNEVCVRAYTTGGKSESVTMSFPRHRADYPMNHPEVVAAIKKCDEQTRASLQQHLDDKKNGLDTKKIKV